MELKSKKYGIHASEVDLSKILDIKLPEPAPDGRIRVLSDKGYATTNIMGTTKEFVEFSSTCKYPVFDIGAAYGEATIAALKRGATVIANEIEDGSLNYIIKRKELNNNDRERLYLKKGFVPFDMDFEPDSLGAIHASRVMHFFKPEEVKYFFKKAHEWLINNGVLFIITSSPFHWFTPDGFYEQYDKKFKEGIEFPGIITDFSHVGSLKTGGYNNAMDPRLIFREATKNEFIIKKLGYEKGRGEYDYTFAILVNRK